MMLARFRGLIFMRYKKTDTPIDQIGRELGVEYVLEGSARREGSRVRVTADLIQVRDQTQLWGDVLEREMAGILVLQNDIAREVAKALALKLLPSERARLATAPPVNPEAHEAFLKGKHYQLLMTLGDLNVAARYFDIALKKDPSYALAYIGHARNWTIRNQLGYASPDEAVPKAKAAAQKALELDDNSAEVHELMAGMKTWIDWDWEGAWKSWRRAIEINPNNAEVRTVYANFLMLMGHAEEALEQSQRAILLDPFNPSTHGWHGYVLYSQRRYDEAIAAAREALRIQKNYIHAMTVLWYAYDRKGMEKEAFEVAKACVKVTSNDPRIDTALEEGYARGGYAAAMKSVAEALIARLSEVFTLPSDIAFFYALAGEKDNSLEWLEKGLPIHDPMLPYLGVFPAFDDLRPDPRFQDLLRKMRLPANAGKS